MKTSYMSQFGKPKRKSKLKTSRVRTVPKTGMARLLWMFSDETIKSMLTDLMRANIAPSWRSDHNKVLGAVAREAHIRGPSVYNKLDFPDDDFGKEDETLILKGGAKL